MNNKMVLGILSVYAVILLGVLMLQIAKTNSKISAPSTSNEVAVEDRLDSAVVIYEDSPVMLVNKEQMLIDKNDCAMVPVIENQSVYVPTAFFHTAYNAAYSEDLATCTATIRLDNQALVLDRKTADLVDSSKEKDIDYTKRVFIKNGCIYVPVEIFADAFDKSVYYYDNMTIISDQHNTFTDTESTDFINSLKSQVNDLPYVVNEENVREISGISSPNNILRQIGAGDETTGEIPPVQLLENKPCNIIASSEGYVFYGTDNKLYILSGGDALTPVSAITFDDGFTCRKIYVYGTTLTIAGDKEAPATQSTGFSHSSMLCVYDISDILSPVKLRETQVEGYYKNSVHNNEFVYVMTYSPIAELYENGHYYPPHYKDSAIGEETEQISFDDMQYFPEGEGDSYTVVSSINLNDMSLPCVIKSYLAAGENVYMSDKNIYIAKDRYNAFDSNEKTENTFIYRLGLLNGTIYTSGKGNVKGYLTNSTSMDEHSGYLRIASSHKNKGTNRDITSVYVLNNNMEICGYANEIVSGVDISSAIFSGNLLFLTPEKTGQSIYSVDLTEPTNPRGNGVIKISRGNLLIYPYDDNHIITIDNGNSKLCINLYDISDKDNPVMLSSNELGRENITTNMFSDISAFYFDEEKNIFALPVTIHDIENSENITFNGCYVFEADLDDGIKRIGSFSLDQSTNLHPYKYAGKIYYFTDNKAFALDYDNMDTVNSYVFTD